MTIDDDILEICNNFKINIDETSHQYNKMYVERLNAMKFRLNEKSKSLWNTEIKPMDNLNDGQKVAVYGIIYKQMKLQHTALKEIEKNLKMEPIEYLDDYTSNDDKIFIEDEFQRLELLNLKNPNNFVSGVVVIIYGFYSSNGTFSVEEFSFPGLPPPGSLCIENVSSKKYVLFISGIEIGKNPDTATALQMLVDILLGIVTPYSDSDFFQNISHVIITGSLFCEDSVHSIKFTMVFIIVFFYRLLERCFG
uniref:DNA polymerase delta small subunit (Trinotate prediction) n=1 Tax=Myxobolus squamalis TaxID=59785 RepID=A0A6B2G3K9_MYXSQ